MDSLISKIVMGWARHLIGMGAAALLTHGYFTGAQADEFTGAVLTLVPLAFSAYDKWHAQQAVQFAARTGLPPGGVQ